MENGFLIVNENQRGSSSQLAQSTDLKIDQVSPPWTQQGEADMM